MLVRTPLAVTIDKYKIDVDEHKQKPREKVCTFLLCGADMVQTTYLVWLLKSTGEAIWPWFLSERSIPRIQEEDKIVTDSEGNVTGNLPVLHPGDSELFVTHFITLFVVLVWLLKNTKRNCVIVIYI